MLADYLPTPHILVSTLAHVPAVIQIIQLIRRSVGCYVDPNSLSDAEYAMRLSRKLGSYEPAAYGFWGFYKTSEGFDMARNKAFYPPTLMGVVFAGQN